MNQTTNTTASIDLGQLDKLEALAQAATQGPWTVRLDGTCSGTWPHIDAGEDEYGDPITVAELSTTHTETEAARTAGGMPGSYEEAPSRFELTDQQPLSDAAFIAAANPATVQQLIALARCSLTSGAPAEPVAEVIEEPAFPGSGIMVRGVRFIDSTAKPGDKLYRAAPVHDAAAPSAEHTQWRNIQKAIRQVAEFCFGGPQQEGSVSMAAAYISVVNCLTAKDGVDLKLEPLSAGAAAKTEQADGTVINYDTILQRGAAGAGSAQPRDTCAEMRALCSSCGGTGDVTSIDGEWRGECNCPAGIALTLDRLKIAAGNTHRENEELRAALARALSRDAGREEASTQKVQSINMQEAIAPQVQVADINSDPYFRHLLGRTFKSEAARQELATCVNTWHASRLERYRRSPPAVGLSNGRLLDLALLASLTGDPAKLIDYGRSVLSAATHPSPLLGASKILVGDIKMEGPSA